MKELLDKILTKNESLAYEDLLHNGASKAAEVSKRTRMPRNKAYDSLYRLEAKELIVSERSKTKRYCIKSPEKIVEMADEEYKKQERVFKDLQKELPQMQMLIQSKMPQPYFTYIRGMKEIMKHIRGELKPTLKFQYMFTRKMTFWEEHKLIEPYKQLIRRGADVRIITADTPKAREIVKKIGAKAIFMPQELVVKKSMIISNRRFTISMYGEHESLLMTTDSQELIDTMKSLFMMMWSIQLQKR